MGDAKAHRKKKAGRKAEKRKSAESKKTQGQHGEANAKSNPKAFVFASRGKAKIQQARSAEKEQKRMHVPASDRIVEEPPPFTVLVQGPPGVGKSTLMRCLLKHYTRQDVRDIKGPITLVAGKSRRLTFLECPQDLASMIDAAKMADLVLLLIDGAFGFEMETFEFLNLLQVHGFPKVMGVLTHLDGFRDNKSLKKTKKALKHRFWTEIYPGAKLFYLSGIRNGKYLKREVHNLARFISVMKFRPLTWRQTHPYLLADRFEDVTPGEALHANPKCDRDVTVYGFVRGTNWRQGTKAHIAGVGDYRVEEITEMPDPCPLPGQEKKRSLNERERLIYAPMSNVGGLLFDKDAMYVEIPDWKVQYSAPGAMGLEEREDGEALVRNLQATRVGIDEKLGKSRIQLFAGGASIDGKNDVVGTRTKRDSLTHSGNEDRVEMNNQQDAVSSDEDTDDTEDFSGSDDEESEDDVGVNAQLSDSGRNGKSSSVTGPSGQDIIWTTDGRMRRRAIFEARDLDQAPKDVFDSDSNGTDDEHDVGANESSMGKMNGNFQNDSSEDNEEGLGAAAKWKGNMIERAAALFSTRAADLQEYIYGERCCVASSEHRSNQKNTGKASAHKGLDGGSDEGDDELFWPKHSASKTNDEDMDAIHDINALDCSRTKISIESLRHWQAPGAAEELRNRFVTGDWQAGEARASARPQDGDHGSGTDSDEDVYGDFEDVETGQVFAGSDDPATRAAALAIQAAEAEAASLAAKKAAKKAAFDSEYDEGGSGKRMKDVSVSKNETSAPTEGDADEEEAETYYDALKRDMAARAQRTKAAMDALDPQQRIAMEGHRPGAYVRLKFVGIPCEMVDHFDPRRPLLVGGLGHAEEKLGYMQFRLKRHRWFPKILKNRDPLIFSVGWRRFQSLPVYAIKDNNERYRMLKYSPEHMHCLAAVWGPLAPPGSGILAVQKLDSQVSHWRVSATGVVLQLDASIHIVKKLKLVGTPFKIHRHTAFVNGMFNSQLEAAKFEGASVRTVSGIRGTIKKALRAGSSGAVKDGAFRATFEDKPLLSDIIFLRAWVKVDIPKFSVPVTNLLAPSPTALPREPKPLHNRRVEEEEHEEEQPDKAGATAAGSGKVNRSDEKRAFIPAQKFSGRRDGFVFTLGSRGLGYYEDSRHSATLASEKHTKGNKGVDSGDDMENTEMMALEKDGAIVQGWVGMRTVAELRREAGIGAPRHGDSLYRDIERAPKVFNPLKIPNALQAALPFKSKPKLESKRRRKTLEQRRAVVVEPQERKKMSLVAQLNAIRNAKAEARRAQRARHAEKMQAKLVEEEAWRMKYNKEQRKKRIIEKAMAEKRHNKRSRSE